MHVLKTFWSYSSITWSSPSLVFNKSCLLYQCSVQFILLFYQVGSAKAIIHLLFTALAFTMKKAVANCQVSVVKFHAFPLSLLRGFKIVAMNYVKVDPKQ